MRVSLVQRGDEIRGTIELCKDLIAAYTTRKALPEPQADPYKIKEIEDH